MRWCLIVFVPRECICGPIACCFALVGTKASGVLASGAFPFRPGGDRATESNHTLQSRTRKSYTDVSAPAGRLCFLRLRSLICSPWASRYLRPRSLSCSRWASLYVLLYSRFCSLLTVGLFVFAAALQNLLTLRSIVIAGALPFLLTDALFAARGGARQHPTGCLKLPAANHACFDRHRSCSRVSVSVCRIVKSRFKSAAGNLSK